MKRQYVRVVHAVRGGLARTPVLGALDAWAGRSRTGLWARSLLAIHDLDEMAALDVPWWTFESAAAVGDFLEARPGARVFEWGSGASTLWLEQRAGEVHSTEHDHGWGEWLRPRLGPTVHLRVIEPVASAAPVVPSAKSGYAGMDFASYVRAIDEVEGEFDLIVVDGRAREACLVAAIERLRPGGMIVVDNVERARYRRALAALPAGTHVRWTSGLTPALPYPSRTALVTGPR